MEQTRSVLLAFAAVFALFFAACDGAETPLEPQELLRNGTMEEAGDVFGTTYWEFEAATPIIGFRTDAEAVSPAHSIGMRAASAPEAVGTLTQSVAVDPAAVEGKDIRLQGWIKVEDIVGSGIVLTLRADTFESALSDTPARFMSTADQGPLSGTRDWTPYEVVLEELPPDIRSITVTLLYQSNTTGQVFFDDVSLTLL